MPIGFLFLPDFQLPGKRKIFKKYFGDLEDSRDLGNSREIFLGLIILLFFWFLAFQISFLAFCYVATTVQLSVHL